MIKSMNEGLIEFCFINMGRKSIQLGLNPFRSNRENTLNLVISASNRENVLKWIASSDLCSSSHKAARKQCQLGTGNCFLQGQIYQNWRKEPGFFLGSTGSQDAVKQYCG